MPITDKCATCGKLYYDKQPKDCVPDWDSSPNLYDPNRCFFYCIISQECNIPDIGNLLITISYPYNNQFIINKKYINNDSDVVRPTVTISISGYTINPNFYQIESYFICRSNKWYIYSFLDRINGNVINTINRPTSGFNTPITLTIDDLPSVTNSMYLNLNTKTNATSKIEFMSTNVIHTMQVRNLTGELNIIKTPANIRFNVINTLTVGTGFDTTLNVVIKLQYTNKDGRNQSSIITNLTRTPNSCNAIYTMNSNEQMSLNCNDNGAEVWAELSYYDGLYTYTTPSQHVYLDNGDDGGGVNYREYFELIFDVFNPPCTLVTIVNTKNPIALNTYLNLNVLDSGYSYVINLTNRSTILIIESLRYDIYTPEAGSLLDKLNMEVTLYDKDIKPLFEPYILPVNVNYPMGDMDYKVTVNYNNKKIEMALNDIYYESALKDDLDSLMLSYYINEHDDEEEHNHNIFADESYEVSIYASVELKIEDIVTGELNYIRYTKQFKDTLPSEYKNTIINYQSIHTNQLKTHEVSDDNHYTLSIDLYVVGREGNKVELGYVIIDYNQGLKEIKS